MTLRSSLTLAALVGLVLLAGCKAPPSTEDKGRQAVVYFKEGVQQFNENKIDVGIATLKKGFELQPTYSLLRQDLARMLLVRAERTDMESIRLAEDAKQLRQESKVEEARRKEEESTSNRRNAIADLRDAQGHFLWLLDATPYEANIPYWLSIVETGLGNYKQARKYLKRAIELGNPSGSQLERLQRALELLDAAELQEDRLRRK